SVDFNLGFRQEQVSEYLHMKTSYLTAHGNEKRTLFKRIDELKRQIALWTHGGNPVGGFDWQIECAEVFTREDAPGFDIVLANHPTYEWNCSKTSSRFCGRTIRSHTVIVLIFTCTFTLAPCNC